MPIACNDRGYRIGECHQNAKWSDAVVERILELREQGRFYREISAVTGVPWSTVAGICRGDRRGQWAERWR